MSHFITQSPEQVKAAISQILIESMDNIAQLLQEPHTDNRKLEVATWEMTISIGTSVLSWALAAWARRLAQQDIQERGVPQDQVQPRLDKDYWGTVNTTFGPVSFPWSAYRQQLGNGASRTHNPAQCKMFPAIKVCRSSSLCLEWESRLGSDHPFRTAQKTLAFFTHGAVKLEDTTIARHLVRVGQIVTRQDMYRTPSQIKDILKNHATRDKKSGRPIVHISSDAHALRRYVDNTWAAQWKMTNGIRIWCEDRKTGRIIHIGGEFTWGDCHEVREIFQDLIARGILPPDGDYGDGVHAQLVWLSDGMPWFKEHIHPLFTDIVVILDAYHLMQAFAALFAMCLRPKSKKAQRLYDQVTELVTGARASDSKSKRPKLRRKPKEEGDAEAEVNNAKQQQDAEGEANANQGKEPIEKTHHSHQRPVNPNVNPIELMADLIGLLFQLNPRTKKARKRRSSLFARLMDDPDRINYTEFRARGYQIGSGAMESMHRTGSQLRLKLPGARWLPHTSQAIFNVRMMRLAGNWESFWDQPDLEKRLAAVELPN